MDDRSIFRIRKGTQVAVRYNPLCEAAAAQQEKDACQYDFCFHILPVFFRWTIPGYLRHATLPVRVQTKSGGIRTRETR